MSKSARAFVALVFCLLAVSFLLPTYWLWKEFRDAEWLTLLVADSHLFFFFPVFGLLVLLAFYIPACAFTDLYWHHLPLGFLRYFVGFVGVLLGASYFHNTFANSPVRAIWEIAPAVMLKEQKEWRPTQRVPGCIDEFGRPCFRQPVLATLQRLRQDAQSRASIGDFARTCVPDRLLERPLAHKAMRYCHPAGARMTAKDCCQVQREFSQHVAKLALDPATRSELAVIEQLAIGFKAFLIVILFVIATMLLIWYDRLKQHYADQMPRITRGVIVGAVAMVPWVLMDSGYQVTSDILFGRNYKTAPFRWSFVIVAWFTLLIMFIMRQMALSFRRLTQPWTMLTPIISGGATWLSFEAIGGIAACFLGVGASLWTFGAMTTLLFLGAVLIYGGLSEPFDSMLGRVTSAAAGAGPAGSPEAPGAGADAISVASQPTGGGSGSPLT